MKIDYDYISVNGDLIRIDDAKNCVYCGQRCYEGELCDEQQADGFEQQRRDEKHGLYPDKWDDAN